MTSHPLNSRLLWLLVLGSCWSSAREPERPGHAVGAQYDTTHVYVAPADFPRLVASLVATFGGTTSKQGVVQVTPTPSRTMSQLVLTPAGTVSVFGFETPIPYPFGEERVGYLVRDIDAAVKDAIKAGAVRRVATFPDPIGRDAVIQWPGGVDMQLYWHTAAPSYAPLAAIPENRIYLAPEATAGFLRSWLAFSGGRISNDERAADGAGIGAPGTTYRCIDIVSTFGKIRISVSEGQLAWPYGREITGYEVSDLDATLDKAKVAGVDIVVPLHAESGRDSAIVRFPGGYIAEVHAVHAR